MSVPSHIAEWIKSSHSMQNGDCIETRHTQAGVDLRDSKSPDGPRLHLPVAAWVAFLQGVCQSPTYPTADGTPAL